MKDRTAILKVHVLGSFSVTYGDNPISFGRNTTTKALKLLQILLYYGEKGIAREKLLEALYAREELADVSNNLRVTVHRLKKILTGAGLPPYEYINAKKGIYHWDAPMPTEVDAHVFTHLTESAGEEPDEEKKIGLLTEAIRMYGGDFLSDLSEDDWVLVEGIWYKERYEKALREVLQWRMDHGEYEEALKLLAPACEMYPFDEWQTIRIECYMALKKYKEAMREYEDTSRMFFEELGISPSERMLELFEAMSSHMNYTPQEIRHIEKRLKEEEEEAGGAYYCSLPSFRDNYRLLSRIIERNGQSVYLMLCSLVNGKGQPLESEKKLEVMSQELSNTIRHCLRRGDSFTRYSPSQFLVLLAGTDKESCSIIFDRVTKYFSREHKSWAQRLEFYVSSVADVENENSEIHFRGKDPVWR